MVAMGDEAAAAAVPVAWRSRRWAPVGLALAVAAAYALGAGGSWVLFHAASVAVFFPPAGITLGALLLTPRRRWPWVLIAAGITEVGVDVWQGQTPMVGGGFGLANTVEPLLGAALFRRAVPSDVDLTRQRDAGAFVLCCVIAGPFAGALVGASTIAWGLDRGWWGGFGPWWAGDGLAVLTLGAAIAGYGFGGPTVRRRRLGWDALMVSLIAALTVAGFSLQRLPLTYLPFPILVALAMSGNVAAVAVAGFVMAFAANVMTGAGYGPWAVLAGQPGLEAATLQLYLAVAVLTAWMLAIGIAERDRARQTTLQEVAANRRLRALQEVTAGLATAATSEQIAAVLVRHGVGLVADYGVVALLDDQEGTWRTFPSSNFPPSVAQRFATVPLTAAGEVPITYAATTGKTVALSSLEEIAEQFPRAVWTHIETGTTSVLAVPVRAGGRSRGALAFAFGTARGADPEIVSVAGTLAELTGQALERAELFEAEHRAAHELQHALLPRIAPDLPGVRVGVSYRPAQTGHDVGGDWYDVFELPGNKVGFTVGDVVGHDLRAATAMGQLQTVLRSVALTGASPSEVLEALDVASTRIEGGDGGTVGYGEYSPAERVVRYACAGHPPPLLVVEGTATYLQDGRSQPIGYPSGPRREAQLSVPEGAALVWYSDGLIERRGEILDVGLRRLAASAAQLSGSDAQAWSDALLAGMTAGQVIEDDVVVACLLLCGAGAVGDGAVLRRAVSSASDLSPTRQAVRTWAAEQNLSPDQTDELALICTEALTNALEHAHREGTVVVELKVTRTDQRHVRVEVSDHGRWRSAGSNTDQRGRGLAVISGLAQRTTIDLRESGTHITAILPTR